MTLLEPSITTEESRMPEAVAAEDLVVPERIVCAPSAGVFNPAPPATVTTEGEIVYAGQVVGSIDGPGSSTAVVSPFTGFFMGMLAHTGERVRAAQPVLWVRVTGS
jgi:biotin carboxyl carrier protein